MTIGRILGYVKVKCNILRILILSRLRWLELQENGRTGLILLQLIDFLLLLLHDLLILLFVHLILLNLLLELIDFLIGHILNILVLLYLILLLFDRLLLAA